VPSKSLETLERGERRIQTMNQDTQAAGRTFTVVQSRTQWDI